MSTATTEAKAAGYTPGPWMVHQQDKLGPRWIIGPDPESSFICRMGTTFEESLAEEAGNARLIAAAPDLAEALRLALGAIPADAMVYSHGDHGDRVYIVDRIGDALRKAGLLD